MAGRARAQQDKPAARAPAAAKNAAGTETASATRLPSPAVAAAILAGVQRGARAAPKTPERKPPAVHATPPPRRSEAPPPVATKPALAIVPAAETPAGKTPETHPVAKPKAAGSKPAAQATAPREADSAAPAAKSAEAAADKAAEPKEQKPAAAGEGAKGGALEAPAEDGDAAGKAAPALELKMPEPPAGPSAATKKRIGGVQARAGGAATAKAKLPPGDVQASGARQAANQPDAEAKAKAQADLVAALGAAPAPSPEIIKLCERIREVIRNKRPPDEDALMEAKPDEEAKNAGNQLNSTVEGETKKVEGAYAPINNPPAGAAPAQGQQLPGQPDAAATKPVNAAAARPDAVPDAAVSLDADAEASKKKIDDAGMNTPTAQLVTSGPVAEARGAQGELAQAAKEDPAKVLEKQKDTLARAEGNMVALQQQALTALTAARAGTAKGATGQQEGMVVSEETKRTKASADAQQIFTDAQKAVTALLDPLARNALDKWEAAKAVLVSKFKADLAPVQKRVEERHSGVSGAVVGVWDAVTGLPGWAEAGYNLAELNFSEGVIAKLKEISAEVNGVIATCELLIKTARDRIAKIFADLGGKLAEWAAQEQATFDKKLDGLQQQAIATRDNFNKDLMDGAKQAVDEVRAEIAELRKKAGGLLGRIANAIARFVDDPVKFIIEGLLELLGIPPAAFWAVVAKIRKVVKEIADDPMKFANNLLKGLAEGFGKFFDNFGTHMLKGFLSWLLGGLKDVQVPKDVSVRSIITFFLQIMGITWPNIRKILVKLIGAKNVALIEKVYSLVTLLIEKGPEGIYEMIKDKLDPQTIVDQVVSMAVDYMVTAIMKQVAVRIVMLFNPAGAILQALEAIYRVLKWIFQNAARIFTLVETVVNGIADILAGNIGGFAIAVEKALGMLIAPVISFIADYLSLGDLPGIVAEKVKSMREWILRMIEKALAWMIEKGKALLAAVGIGKKDDKKDNKGDVEDGLGETIVFSAEGHVHTLWIEQKAGSVTVLVKSKTTAVENMLDDFAEKLTKMDDKKRKSEGRDLISTARDRLDETVTDGKKELTADLKAKQDTADANAIHESQAAGQTTKAAEGSLAQALEAVFEFFGLSTGIITLIGKPVTDNMEAPTGYTLFKDGPYREIRRNSETGGEYPEVHVDLEGLIQYGSSELTRFDRQLIEDWETARAKVEDQFGSDGAPKLDDVEKFLIAPLNRKLTWQFRWGIRNGLRGLITEINSGSPVIDVEKKIGRARVDWIISMIAGVGLPVLVEYKHWTAVKDKDVYTRAEGLRKQLEEYVHNARIGKNNYPAVIVKWPGFSRLSPFARGVFRATLITIEAYAKLYGVAVVQELE